MFSISNDVLAAGNLETLVEERQVLLQTDKQLPIDPSVIGVIDGGLIVAGYSATRAWAAKTDMAGKILWIYAIEKPAGYERYPWLQVRPEFRCATGMSDGSVWLGGSTIDSNAQLGLLVALGPGGAMFLRAVLRDPRSILHMMQGRGFSLTVFRGETML